MDSGVASIVGSLIGGGMTGIASWWVMSRTLRHNQQMEEERSNSEVRSFLQAIQVEINVIADLYSRVGTIVENLEDGCPFNGTYPIYYDYFTVYHSNARLLGKIKDDAVRKAIITYYSKAKGLVDSFRHNNELNLQRDHWVRVFDETQKPIHYHNYQKAEQTLVNYANGLKSSTRELKGFYEVLKTLLQDSPILSENLSGGSIPMSEENKNQVWKAKANAEYQKVVSSIISLSTATLVLPTLFLKDFIGLAAGVGLWGSLSFSVIAAWALLLFSIACCFVYYYASAKWLKQAYGGVVKWPERTIETCLNITFWAAGGSFILGLLLLLVFMTTYTPTN